MNTSNRSRRLSKALMIAFSSVFLIQTTVVPVSAQTTISTQSVKRQSYSTAELDQMLAPIALYPDQLLIQVLFAATYPNEVAEAGQWLSENRHLTGEEAMAAAEDVYWNDSIKSLLAFPDLLITMSTNMGWTVKLGNAFNLHQAEMMDRVQVLRQQALANGSLQTDERMQVVTTGNTIVIQPASPEVVYVPYYVPSVVYGHWHWPGYAPYYWSPWRGYSYRTGFTHGFFWGSGVFFSFNYFFGKPDWHRRHVYWNPPKPRPNPKPRPKPTPKPRPGAKPNRPGAGNHLKPNTRPPQGGNQAKPGSRPGQSGNQQGAGNRPGQGGNQAKPGSRPGQSGNQQGGGNRPSQGSNQAGPGGKPGQSAGNQQKPGSKTGQASSQDRQSRPSTTVTTRPSTATRPSGTTANRPSTTTSTRPTTTRTPAATPRSSKPVATTPARTAPAANSSRNAAPRVNASSPATPAAAVSRSVSPKAAPSSSSRSTSHVSPGKSSSSQGKAASGGRGKR